MTQKIARKRFMLFFGQSDLENNILKVYRNRATGSGPVMSLKRWPPMNDSNIHNSLILLSKIRIRIRIFVYLMT